MKKRIITTLLSLAVVLTLLPAQSASAARPGTVKVAQVGDGSMEITNTARPTLTGWWTEGQEFAVDYTLTNEDSGAGRSLFAVLTYSTGPMETYQSGLHTLDAGWELRFFDVSLNAGETVDSKQATGVDPWRTRVYGSRVLDGSSAMAVIYCHDNQQMEDFRRELSWYNQRVEGRPSGDGPSYVDTSYKGTGENYTLAYNEENRALLRQVLSHNSDYTVKTEEIRSPFPGVSLDQLVVKRDYSTDPTIQVSDSGKSVMRAHLGVDLTVPLGTEVRAMVSGEVIEGARTTTRQGERYDYYSIKHESGLILTYDGLTDDIPYRFKTCGICTGSMSYPEEAKKDSSMHGSVVAAGDVIGYVGPQTFCQRQAVQPHTTLHVEITDGFHWPESIYREYYNSTSSTYDSRTALDPMPILKDGVLTWTVYGVEPWSKPLDPEKDFSAQLIKNLKNGNQDSEGFDTYNQSRMAVKGYILGEYGGSLAIEFTNDTDGVDTGGCIYMLTGILKAEPPLDPWTTPPDPDKYYPMESVGFHYRLEPGASAMVYLPVTIAVTQQIIEASKDSQEHWSKLAGAGSPQLIIGRAENPEEYQSISNQVIRGSYGSGEKIDKVVDFVADFEYLGRRIEFQETLYDVFGPMLPN